MIPTLDYVKQKFQEYNEQMFGGKLQQLPFKLSSARSFLGEIRCVRKKQPDGTWHYTDFAFVISNKIDMPQDIVDDAIIHEMIHYYIFSNQLQDNGPHGDLFKEMMRKINVKFNRNISVFHKKTEDDEKNDTEKRQHLICIVRMRGNSWGVTVASKAKLFYLWDELPKFPKVVECKWYVSTDPFFNRFPRAKSVKIYAISRQEMEEHTKDAQPLIREGNSVKAIKD